MHTYLATLVEFVIRLLANAEFLGIYDHNLT